MTPKEKAAELFNSYRVIMFPIIDNKQAYHGESLFSKEMAKKSALIAASMLADECNKYFEAISQDRVNYWVAVKAEIENL